MNRRSAAGSLISLALLGLVALVLVGWVVGGRDQGTAVTAPPATSAEAFVIEVVALSHLPPEAAQVWQSIKAGGPFRFRQDGSMFQNREGVLPRREPGCYREYTVPTPGEDDRGARRLVTDCDGRLYYTADHYRSFVAVDPDR